MAGDILIRASAGTGKTFALSSRYLELLLSGERPESILATTFTKKAAGEILERILSRLADGTRSDADATRLSDELQIERRTADQFAAALHELVAELHQVRVSTLDAFFAKLGQAYALELKLPAGWRILEPSEELASRLRAVDRTLTSLGPTAAANLLHMLDKGATKRSVTRNLIETIGSFLDIHRDATPPAWDCLDHVTPPSDRDVESVCEAIEADETGAASVRKGFYQTLMKIVGHVRAGQWEQVAKAGLIQTARTDEPTYYRKPLPTDIVERLRLLATAADAELINRLAEQGQATGTLLDSFGTLFAEEKTRVRGLQFDDVTRSLAAAVQSNLATDYRLDGDIKHLLLDEFQDTSFAQWDVIQPLARSASSREDGSVFCVGDVKQAIYAWRGGVAAIFDAFEQSIVGIETASLDLSYRSSNIVIETVNAIFGRLTDLPMQGFAGQPGIAEWSRRYDTHRTTRTELSGYAEVRAMPDFTASDDGASDRLDWVANQVAALHSDHAGHTIGVLTRTRADVVALSAYLRARGLAVSEEGGQPILDSAAVQLMRSLLLLVNHPGDTNARFHIANSPLAAATGLKTHDDDEAAYALSERLREMLTTEPFGRFIRSWSRLLIPVSSQRDLGRIRQLVALADEYESVPDGTVDEFLRLLEQTNRGDATDAAIRVMTIHQSKGLEFDVCVLPQLDQPIARPERKGYAASRPSPTSRPDRLVRYAGKEIQDALPSAVQSIYSESATEEVIEGLCLFYVAATRAKRAMHFLVAPDEEDKLERRLKGQSIPAPADFLRATLAHNKAMRPDTVVWQHGDANWSHGGTSDEPTHEEPRESVAVRLDTPKRVRRDRIRRSPSQFERDEQRDRVHQSPPQTGSGWPQHLHRAKPGQSAARGTLLHRWLEQIRWLGDGVPKDEELTCLANTIDVPPPLTPRAIADFRASLELDVVRDVLDRTRYRMATDADGPLTVLTEQSFAVPFDALAIEQTTDENAILSGSIDRLVIAEKGGRLSAEIIDWKTDRIESQEQLDAAAAIYGPQMAAYRDAVRVLFGIDRDEIDVRLVFLNPGRTVTLSAEMGTAVVPQLRDVVGIAAS